MGLQSKINIRPLTEANYITWSFKVEWLLKSRKVWQVIDPTSSQEHGEEASIEAMTTIVMLLSEEFLVLARESPTPRELWSALKERCASQSKAAQMNMRHALLTMQQEDQESVTA